MERAREKGMKQLTRINQCIYNSNNASSQKSLMQSNSQQHTEAPHRGVMVNELVLEILRRDFDPLFRLLVYGLLLKQSYAS